MKKLSLLLGLFSFMLFLGVARATCGAYYDNNAIIKLTSDIQPVYDEGSEMWDCQLNGGGCIEIGGINITLDCQGYKIFCSGDSCNSCGAGAIMVYSNNVTITNCSIQGDGWTSAVSFAETTTGGLLYNNIFNRSIYIHPGSASTTFSLNTTKTLGRNIVGGDYIGGNFYSYPNGTGYSQTCADSDNDTICDNSFAPSNYTGHETTIDYLPLTSLAAPAPPETTHYCDSCVSCNDTINNASSGDTIFLNTSITGDGSSDCIDANYAAPSNITLDCQGYSIIGIPNTAAEHYGIITANNMTINNCSIHDWLYSYATGYQFGVIITSGVLITNSNISYNTDGFRIYGSNNIIRNNVFIGDIENTLYGGGYNLIENNTLIRTGTSFYTGSGSYDTIIRDNTFTSCSKAVSVLGTVNITNNYMDSCYYTIETVNGYDNAAKIFGNTIINSVNYGLYVGSSGNLIYNNFLNNSVNFFDTTQTNTEYFNITATNGINIIGGSKIGGNFWAYPNGTGYSETCANNNNDSFCDSAYALDGSNSDFLPLTNNYPIVPPTITIVAPTNVNYTTTTIALDVSADEPTDAWWYSLNGGSNTTFTPNTTIAAAQGTNDLFVYANDTTGNIGEAGVSFFVDSIAPDISWNTPANNSVTQNQSWTYWNVTIGETPDTCLLNLNGTLNIIMDKSGNYCSYNYSGANATTIRGMVYANDTYGNMNLSSERWVTINLSGADIVPPNITIISPIAITYTTSSVALAVSADEPINTWWYNLNGGANTSFIPNTTISGLASGVYTLNVYASDLYGNEGFSSITFTLQIPVINNLGFFAPIAGIAIGGGFLLFIIGLFLEEGAVLARDPKKLATIAMGILIVAVLLSALFA